MGHPETDPLIAAIGDAGEGWLALALTLWPETGGDPPAWFDAAACRTAGHELFFSGSRRRNAEAQQVCAGCPVRRQCQGDVLRWETTMPEMPRPGVAAGMTGGQRSRLRNQHREAA